MTDAALLAPRPERPPLAFGRREVLAGAVAFFSAPGAIAAAASGHGPKLGRPKPFSWELLQREAMAMADRRYVRPYRSGAAAAVDYDALNHIHYRPEAELWRGRAQGAVRFFPLSRWAPEPIAIHVVEGGQARPVQFALDLFDMPADSPARRLVGADAGFAGFRVMNPSDVGDWIAYLGASYFRSAGPLNQYGLSARGLALDTAVNGPEEFPLFHSFWLEPADESLTIYALLESQRATGVWRFVTRRTSAGVIQDVSCNFRLRGAVERLGIAPLTSMYWYGETEMNPRADWRPEIHDSDGLLILNGAGERLWRPLVNPPAIQVNSFVDRNPRGFGLLQRDRAYSSYEDDGVFYHKRPSLWVEPTGDWGEGAVELVELPTAGETDDNIVAFWRPAVPARAGTTLDLSYRLSWIATEPVPSPLARVVATRRGFGGVPGLPPRRDETKLVVDFEGEALAGKGRNAGVTAELTVDRGRVVHSAAYPVVDRDRTWRMMLDLAPEKGATMDIRATLVCCGQRLSETWLYQLHG
jgi:glucans biosynthesis protein